MSQVLPSQFSATRLRSYIVRLPIFTRAIVGIIVACYVASLFTGIEAYAALQPSSVTSGNLGKLGTFPFVHKGFFHTIFNILALIPLLDRFECENGTIVSLLLFFGPFCTLPGLLYVIFEYLIFQSDTPVEGASVWVFLLLAIEAVKTYRANPYFTILTTRIPTWTTPLVLIFTVSFLVPNTSLIGHLCGAAVGYPWGLGYLKILVPPEGIIRWLEEKLQLLERVPRYVSVDQKTYGRYGLLPSFGSGSERWENGASLRGALQPQPAPAGQRLGP